MITVERHSTRQKLNLLKGEETLTPISLAEIMINGGISEEILKNPKSKFLDPCAGIGTYLIILFWKLRKYHSEEHILTNMLYACEIKAFNIRALKNLGLKNVYFDFLKNNFNNMKFDVIIGNPPYNTTPTTVEGKVSESGLSISKGDRTLGTKFVHLAMDLCKDKGIVCLVTLKSIYRALQEPKFDNLTVTYMDFMIDTDVWGYNTCWFVGKKQKISQNYKMSISDPLFNKLIGYKNELFGVKSTSISKAKYKKWTQSENLTPNTPYLNIIKLPGKRNPDKITGYFSSPGHLNNVPKVMFSRLESWVSILYSEEGIIGESDAYIEVLNKTEGDNLVNLCKSSLVKFFISKLKFTRGHYDVFRYLKKIDLNQDLSTNDLIYQAYNLTQDEINLIENTIK